MGTPQSPSARQWEYLKGSDPCVGGWRGSPWKRLPLCLARCQAISLAHRPASIDEAKNGRTHARVSATITPLFCVHTSAPTTQQEVPPARQADPGTWYLNIFYASLKTKSCCWLQCALGQWVQQLCEINKPWSHLTIKWLHVSSRCLLGVIPQVDQQLIIRVKDLIPDFSFYHTFYFILFLYLSFF